MASIAQYVADVRPAPAPMGPRAAGGGNVPIDIGALPDIGPSLDKLAAVQEAIDRKQRAAFDDSEVVYRTAQVSQQLDDLQSQLQQEGLPSGQYMEKYNEGFRKILLDQRLDPTLSDPALRERVSQHVWSLGMRRYSAAKKYSDGLFLNEKEGVLVGSLDFVRKALVNATSPQEVEQGIQFGDKLIAQTYGAIAPDKVAEQQVKWRDKAWKDYAKEWSARDPKTFLADVTNPKGVLVGKIDVDTQTALTRSAIAILNQQQADLKKGFEENSDKIAKGMYLRMATGGTVTDIELQENEGVLSLTDMKGVIESRRTWEAANTKPTPTNDEVYWQVIEDIATGRLRDQGKLAERLRGQATPEDYRSAVNQLNAAIEHRRALASVDKSEEDRQRAKGEGDGQQYISTIFESGGPADFSRMMGQVRGEALMKFNRLMWSDPKLNPHDTAEAIVQEYSRAAVDKITENYGNEEMRPLLKYQTREDLNTALKNGWIGDVEYKSQKAILLRLERLAQKAGVTVGTAGAKK